MKALSCTFFQIVCANHRFFSPSLSHQGLFQNLCPSVPGGSVCQWKALGNTTLERWPARLLRPHARQHTWPLPGSHSERLHGGVVLTQQPCASRLEPTQAAGGTLSRSPPPLVAPSLLPSIYFLVGRNKVTNYDAMFFQGK